MARCVWCNRTDGEMRTVTVLAEGRERRTVTVHAAHEAPFLAWHARVASDTPRFVMTIAFTPLVLLVAVGVAALVGRPAVALVLGLAATALAVVMWTHPYATPQTVRLVGVRRSIALARAGALLMGLVGLVAAIAVGAER
jgi:hypothetical protein